MTIHGATNPHDALFRAAFSAPERATDLLRHLLPGEIAAKVDWSSLRLVDGTFIDSDLARRHTDLLFSAKLRGRSTRFYVLFEHRSYGSRALVLKLADYVARVLMHLATESPGKPVPPVVPLVIQHGEGARGPCRLRDMVDFEGMPESIVSAHLDMTFLFEDLDSTDAEEILAWRARAYTRLTLLHLKQVSAETPTARLLLSWADLFCEVADDAGADRLLEQLLSYAVTLARKHRAAIFAAYEAMHPKTKELLPTIADQLRQEGRQETLRVLAEERFGPLPQETLTRIERTDEKALDRLIRRILTATSLEDLFA